LANVPRPGLRPGLLLDFAKAHHLSRVSPGRHASWMPLRERSEASTHPLGPASWHGLAQDRTVSDIDGDHEAPWTGSRRVPAWARPFLDAPHASGRCAFAAAAAPTGR